MSALASSKNEVLLLLLPGRGEMYALHPAALTRAQTARRKLSSDYRDALLMSQDGTIRRIDSIDVLGPWGTSLSRRLLSRLTDAWSIKVSTSQPITISLDDLKDLLVRCIQSQQSVESLLLETRKDQEQFIDSVKSATSTEDLMGRLRLPSPEDALDVL